MCVILLGCVQIWHFYRTLFRGLLFFRTQCTNVEPAQGQHAPCYATGAGPQTGFNTGKTNLLAQLHEWVATDCDHCDEDQLSVMKHL